MTAKTLFSALLALSTAACAHPPVAPTPDPGSPPGNQAQVAPPASPMLTERVLYQFLLAELAGQRGELALACEAYVDLAKRTRDVRIAKRATEIAIYARKPAEAAQAARIWQELEPASAKARQTYLSLLINAGRLQEARPHLEALINQGQDDLGNAFLQIHSLMARHQDKQAVLSLLSELVGAYAAVPEAQFVLAQAAAQAGQDERAAQALDQALQLKPGWEAAALVKGQLLSRQGEGAASTYWQAFLADHPNAREVRLAYAKQLARMSRFAEARQQFATLLEQMHGHPEVLVALGLLSMQMNDLDAAEASFKEALERGHDEADQVRMYLGQLSDGRRKYQDALEWYLAVAGETLHFDAQLRAALVLAKLNRVEDGRELLRALDTPGDSERIQVIQTESQMLREVRDFQGVFAVLGRGLEAYPDAPELLYDRAMAAEKIDRLDVLEQDLRRLIQLKPDHAHAHNALGYTLADRTERLAEAIALLDKALKLAPDDPFIHDSMGWALFKAKRLGEAVDYLRRAYKARPDPDIAAHLGEVLWVKGDKDEARRIWQSSIKAHPDNESLRETLSRLQP